MKQINRILPSWLVFALAVAALVTSGCNRNFYRRQADTEAYALVQQKAFHPHWPLKNYSINIDPRSRMYSPFCDDYQPLPPDDPYSHQMMHRVDNKRGYPFWHVNGDTPFVENPMWLAYLPVDENGVVVLDANGAVKTALLHSRDYQGQLETLYLSALDVSFERFNFDTQFFGGYSTDYAVTGPERRGNGGQSRSNLAVSTFSRGPRGISFRKMGTTGSTLVVGLANTLMWQFSGPVDSQTATTLLDFSLVQPLLRRAGRDRIMETLTLAERTLLANVRQMERYRRGFYLSIMTGQSAGQGPSRRGGIFGGSGLGGFTGTGSGGFGGLGGGGGGGFGGAGAGAAQAGGYMGLLQNQQDIRNQEINIAALRSSLAQFREFAAADRIDYLQVQQSQQALYNAQSRLLNSKTTYQNSLDSFKVTLGLPPQLEVRIQDSMLNRFNLIDVEITKPQNQLTDVQQEIGSIIVSLLDEIEQNGPLWTPQLAEQLGRLKVRLAEAETIRQHVAQENVARARDDIAKLRQAIPRRVEDLRRLRERAGSPSAESGTPDVDPAVLDERRLTALPDELTKTLDALNIRLDSFQTAFAAQAKGVDLLVAEGQDLDPQALLQRLRDKVFSPIPNELTELAVGILELSLVQARARTDSIGLVSVDLTSDAAIEIARDYRRDWMNARAALVDAWRLIEFNADDLESSLDIVFEGDIGNVRNNPLNLQGTTGRLRAGLQFDAPLTRLSERNIYRQSLIEYSQARRNYYAIVDQISQGLRNTVRTIDLNQLNFELRRAAVLVAIEQVELARLRLQEPPRPGAEAQQGLGPTTARDLVSALSDLQSAQNDYTSVWVNYEVLRRSLDFNLGTMELDEDGLWIDPGPVKADRALPPPPGVEFCVPDALPQPQSSSPRDASPAPDSAERQSPQLEEIAPPANQRSERAPVQSKDQGPQLAPAANRLAQVKHPLPRLTFRYRTQKS